MGQDLSDVIGTAIGYAAREAVHEVSTKARKRSRGPLAGRRGVAAGATGLGLMALAPLAGKGVSKLRSGGSGNGSGPLEKVKSQVLEGAGDKVKGQVADAIPGGKLFSKDGGSEGVAGVGKGRRMPVQQDIDIGAPLKVVYNQWTQFEEWPKFMHRVQQVSQEDERRVHFKTKIWGVSREFTAEILEQRPDERIAWRVADGITHSGVVSFHELGPRLTRVELNFDVEPGGLIEKAARGMRFVKRAARADLARFKGYVLMQEEESGSWRGRIEDGKVKRRSGGGSRPSSRGGSSSKGNRSSSESSPSGSRRSSGSAGSRSASSSRSGSTTKRTRGSTNGRSRSSGNRSSASSRRRSASHS